jgi:hypothetical protein
VGIVQHVVGAEASYLRSLGGKPTKLRDDDYEVDMHQVLKDHRQAVLDALEASARGELPLQGPRGGIRWTPRFFVRRAAWHILDHVWEIEDRVV